MATVGKVGMVREVHCPGDDDAVDEDGLGQHDVRQMGAAALIGVVADEDVAGLHAIGRMPPQDLLDDPDEAAEMHRDVLGLAQRPALRVEQRGRAVPPLLDVRRIARPDQRLAHLLDDGRQRAADHLGRDRVDGNTGRDGVGHQPGSRMRLPYGSTVPVMPGRITVVASIWVHDRGALDAMAGRSWSRA